MSAGIEADIAGVHERRLVVIVDDDPAVCHSLRFALEIEGYEVRLYNDADAFLAEHPRPGDGCLVIDYHLPGMNGLDLVAHARAIQPDVCAILITTDPTSRVRAQAVAAGVPIVEKPLFGNTLAEAIRRSFPAEPPPLGA